MRVHLSHPVAYREIDARFNMTIAALFSRLQEAAVSHSEQAGHGSRSLVADGRVWVLNAITADIHRYPAYTEDITVTTWHRESRGFKAFREFTVSINGEPLLAATSLWLFYDLNTRKLTRVPTDTGARYSTEPEKALAADIDRWKPGIDFTPAVEADICTRADDYDPLGHVNNAAYFSYIDTLVSRAYGPSTAIRAISVKFLREVGRDREHLKVGAITDGAMTRIKIYADQTVFAAAELTLTDDGAG